MEIKQNNRYQFLTGEQDKYRKEIQRIVKRWLKKLKKRADKVEEAIVELEGQLMNAAGRYLRKAYKLGLGTIEFAEEDAQNIDAALDSNRIFIRTSLIPAIMARINGLRETLPWPRAVTNSQPFSLQRSGLYAGLFWVMVWVGLGSALERRKGQTAKATVPVLRVLDPGAKHCGTCPGKAGVYNSWNEMLVFTGGLPADGSDECHSNCRCTIFIKDGGAWVGVL